MIFLEPVPNSCCSTIRCPFLCTLFCRGQCSCIRLTHYFSDLILLCIYFHCTTTPSGTGPPHYQGLVITLRHTTYGRTPLEKRSACRRKLYLTKHNTKKRQTSTPPVGFKPAIAASERSRTHGLNRAVTEITLFWQPFVTKCHSVCYMPYLSLTVQMYKKRNLKYTNMILKSIQSLTNSLNKINT